MDTGDTTDLARIEARRSEQKARGINGNGFGQSLGEAARVWMTPNVPNGGRTASHAIVKGRTLTREDGTKVQLGLEHQAQTWSTPPASDGEKGGPNMSFGAGRVPLPTQAAHWPTPNVGSENSMRGAGQDPAVRKAGGHQVNLKDAAEYFRPLAAIDLSLPHRPTPSGPKSSETRRRLNPLFVEWLMGWPEGLSGFDTAAMASYHSPQPSHGCGCMDCWLTQQRAMLSDLLTIDPPAQGLLL
ncbi:hypothetical protein [Sphingomonas hankookensis]|uniref:Uncharacterized protein n=1 Tax=Sphingomonas hankookensis TaxID=563996 RepID=A0ABR5Y9H3_9SPHN|nr:hypothetical protein [Sphingomonas hankookensis]KZE08629.1 hypothetical protein AVT10_08745 [Sphingomonas hankookensis]